MNQRTIIKTWITVAVVTVIFLLVFSMLFAVILKPKRTWSRENDRYINDLHPAIRNDVAKLINRCAEKGIFLKINSGFRSFERQAQLDSTMGAAAAPAGKSFHNYGLAVDIGVSGHNLATIEKIAKEIGFEWGGDWASPYEPWHFQKTFGLDTTDLLAQKNRGVFDKYPPINKF